MDLIALNFAKAFEIWSADTCNIMVGTFVASGLVCLGCLIP